MLLRLLLLCVLLLGILPAQANVGIVAVVNDDVITSSDLEERMKLTFLLSNRPDTPQSRNELTPLLVERLVMETLQKQEMKRRKITITDEMVDKALVMFAEQQKTTPEALKGKLVQLGVSPQTLKEQISAEFGWSQLLFGKLKPRITVSDSELAEAREQILGSYGGGAQKGDTELLLAQLVYRLPAGAVDKDIGDAKSVLQPYLEKARNCGDFEGIVNSNSALEWSKNRLQLKMLNTQTQAIAANLRVGQPSEPFVSKLGVHSIMICERIAPNAPAIQDEKVKEAVIQRKLQRKAAELMQQLRQDAYIEVRL